MLVVILIGGALLLGIGPFATANSSGEGDASRRIPTFYEKRAERFEKQLAEDPEDRRKLLAVMQEWISAGNDRLNDIDTPAQPVPSVVSEDFHAGLRAWNRYLQQTGGKAETDVAAGAGGTFFQLVEIGSKDPAEATANAAGAARALRIVCRQKRNREIFNLSNLAVYEYFNGELAAGDKAAREAAASVAHPKEEGGITPREVIEQLNEYKVRGEKFVGRVEEGAKTLEESGDEELETPIKGYGSAAGINGYEPGTGPNEPVS